MLFAGCSAGGLTTYIHADYVTESLKTRAPSAKVVAVADAMYSLNHDLQHGKVAELAVPSFESF